MFPSKYRDLGEAMGDFRSLLRDLDVRNPSDPTVRLVPRTIEEQKDEDRLIEWTLSEAWKPATTPDEIHSRTAHLSAIADRSHQAVHDYAREHGVRLSKPIYKLHKDDRHNMASLRSRAAAAHSALARHAREAQKSLTLQHGDIDSATNHRDIETQAKMRAAEHSAALAGFKEHEARVAEISRKQLQRHPDVAQHVAPRSQRKSYEPARPAQPATQPAPRPAAVPRKAQGEAIELTQFRRLAGLDERPGVPWDLGISGTTKHNEQLLAEAGLLSERLQEPAVAPKTMRVEPASDVMKHDPVKLSRDAMWQSWYARHHKGSEGARGHSQLASTHLDVADRLREMAKKSGGQMDGPRGQQRHDVRRKGTMKLLNLSKIHREIGSMHAQNQHHPSFESILGEEQLDEFFGQMIGGIGRGIAAGAGAAGRGLAKGAAAAGRGIATGAAKGATAIGAGASKGAASVGRGASKAVSAMGRGAMRGAKAIGTELAVGAKDAARDFARDTVTQGLQKLTRRQPPPVTPMEHEDHIVNRLLRLSR